MKKVRAKEVLQGDWIITDVHQGYNNQIRIKAKRRFHRADEQNFYCDWVTLKYANRCRRDVGQPPLTINF